MRKVKTALQLFGVCFASLAAGYLLLLCFPQPLFAYHLTWSNLTLYCDDPIAANAPAVLQDAQRRLVLCPLYAGRPCENIFLCNHDWRYKFFANRHSGAGGFAYACGPQNVFLRKADVAQNTLFTRKGASSGPDRPLSYFMAHEITHNLTSRDIGLFAFLRLPAWIQEGYADYVGKGGDFNFKKNLALFKKDDPALNPSASGLYLRYHLLTAYLLDRKKISVQALLTGSFDRVLLEKELRDLPG